MRSKASALFGTTALLSLLAFAGQAAAADPCANAQFRVGASAALPDCRAYERVSPVDKNGGDIQRNVINQYATSRAARSGDSVAYASQAQFADIKSGAPYAQYVSVRSPVGWLTKGLSPLLLPGDSINSTLVQFLSDDLSWAIVQTNAQLAPGASDLDVALGLYLQMNNTSPFGYALVSVPSQPLPPDSMLLPLRFDFVGASGDAGHVAFTSTRTLVPGGQPDFTSAVYEWDHGQVRLASVLPDGGVPGGFVVPGARNPAGSHLYPGGNVISPDGSRLYFSVSGAGEGTDGLYVRESGVVTDVVGGSERTGDDPDIPVAGAEFQMAARDDGSLAVFKSFVPLTDDAKAGGPNGADLYLWDGRRPKGVRLTDLTTEDPDGGGVVGAVAASDDGDRVYFVATGKLVADATAGSPNIYLWERGVGLRFVATLAPGSVDGAVWGVNRNSRTERYRDVRTAAGGRFLLFTAHSSVSGYDTAGHKQVYLYDAATQAPPTCVSCSPLTSTSTGDAGLMELKVNNVNSETTPDPLPRNLSADGKRVFFETTEPLIADDHNQVADVYMWEDGGLHLISSGRLGASAAELIDASASGDDVFFTSGERLAPADSDDQVDVYDARVGGGFPTAPMHDCLGDACRDVRPSAPSTGTPATSGFVGAGNVRRGAHRCAKAKLMRGGHCVAKRAIARHACRKRHGAAKRRCIRRHVRRLNRAQQKRTARANRRAHR